VNGAFTGALEQAWPPFVLVTGLLLVGVAAASDGLFEAAGSRIARLPGGGLALFASLMALVAAVTAVLNLDTAVVFLTPVLLHAARRRGVSEIAFLYGAVFMSNSASLLLPGSNLTNLLVLSRTHSSGGAFAADLFPSWIAAIVVTSGVLVVWRWSDLRVQQTGREAVAPLRFGPGLPAVVAAAVLVLVLANPAVPVLVLGAVVATVQVARDGRLDGRAAFRAIGAPTLAGLFALVVALGTLARSWGAPGRLMASIGAWPSALLGAGTADVVNNLPAAVLLASRPPAHPEALLIGLDLGPNLVVTGALSAILWMRIARHEGAKPSAWRYTKVGAVLVPLSMAAALGALDLFVHGLA
jgi:arsenical pump membrane protein